MASAKKASKPKASEAALVRDYRLVKPFTNTNSGFARWTFGTKDGTEYFLKEFLSPVCPHAENVSPAKYARSKDICDRYYAKKRRLYQAIKKSDTGNIVTVSDFFFFGTRFYIATEKIDTFNCSIEEISRMPDEAKLLLMKVLSSCLMSLHENGVVHADLKPNNILVKKTKAGALTAKLIDFDGSYLVGEQPGGEELQGDQIYLAPETCRAMHNEDVRLTQKVDVFALGVLFHQYLTGNAPVFSSQYAYAHEALLHGDRLSLSERVPLALRELVGGMLERLPGKRPTTQQILQTLQTLSPTGTAAAVPCTPSAAAPRPAPSPAEKDGSAFFATATLRTSMPAASSTRPAPATKPTPAAKPAPEAKPAPRAPIDAPTGSGLRLGTFAKKKPEDQA